MFLLILVFQLRVLFGYEFLREELIFFFFLRQGVMHYTISLNSQKWPRNLKLLILLPPSPKCWITSEGHYIQLYVVVTEPTVSDVNLHSTPNKINTQPNRFLFNPIYFLSFAFNYYAKEHSLLQATNGVLRT